MKNDPSSEELNFDPTVGPAFGFGAGGLSNQSEDEYASLNPPVELVATFVAESSIVRAIVQGSGGPDNSEITEDGLRFVRYLLANSRSIRFGFMPNFKNMDSIRELAREFIRRCGSAACALQTMHTLTTACD